ncbi:aminopeptidase N [Micavibrio aeruginosavorus]|uniref:aminopeptidase N n=1 Tax=Micavibrio aeruginosavorus TaxID=349221 RepID=UPI003F4AD6DF
MAVHKNTAANKMIYLKDYKQPDFFIRHTDLEFDIRDGHTIVTSRMRIDRNGDHNRPLVLDGEDLKLRSVFLNGVPLNEEYDYTVDDKHLSFVPMDDSFVVETVVKIHPEDNTELSGLYKSGDTYCTQCESQGFRRITYYIDRPDNMGTFTTKVIADKDAMPVLLSNGNMINKGETADGRHFTIWHDPFPKPSYLFALVAADLQHIEDKYTTQSGRDVTLRIYAEDKDIGKLDFAMDSLKKSMKWDEDVYGREYDLDLFNIVAVDAFNAGAMENKSLNIFNTSAVLAHADTQTDDDFEWVRGVVAHEYFHNWSGNRVTCRDWFQLTLKEGFTVYRDAKFSADMGSAPIKRIEDVIGLRARQFAEDAGPMAHPIRPDRFENIENFYTGTVYRKGAEIIGMLHSLLGDETYRAATDLYFDRHDGQAVTCEDFLACMEEASGRDLSQFKRWYAQAGTPRVQATWERKENGVFTLTLEQSQLPSPGQPKKKLMHIPVKFGLVGPNGADIDLDGRGTTTAVLELTRTKQKFTFKNIPEGSVPSILRDFSAPVILNAEYTDAELKHLMVHDSDGFNQFEAGNRFVRGYVLEQVEQAEKGLPTNFGNGIIDAFRDILNHKRMDNGLKALMLSLPSYSEIAQTRPSINPEAIRFTLMAFRLSIARALAVDFVAAYLLNHDPRKTYSMDVQDVGQRSLKNTALSYLAETNVTGADKIVFDQFETTNNMNDRLSAFSTLLKMDYADENLKDQAIAQFYDTYHADPLPLNRWFSTRISTAGFGALDMAKMLAQHELFDPLNPNSASALYGAFAGTVSGFHRADGEGYKFMGSFIADIDSKNAHTAAGMVGTLANWRKYAEPWQSQQKAVLLDLAAMPEQSKSLHEKLKKILGPDYPPQVGAHTAPKKTFG